MIKLTESFLVVNNSSEQESTTTLALSACSPNTQVYYQNTTLGLSLGICRNSDCASTVFSGDEFISVISGKMNIKHPHTGKLFTIAAGDSIVIPKGYQCYGNDCWQAFYLSYAPPVKKSLKPPINESPVFINDNNAISWQKTSDGYSKKLLYQSVNNKFTSGIWQGSNFKTNMIAFPYNELMILKHGTLMCTDENRIEHKISVGQTLFIPQGTRCAWQAQGEVSLYFVQIKP